MICFSSMQLLSHVQIFVNPWTAPRQVSLSITKSQMTSPSSKWCHPTISCFVIPFSSWLQSFPDQGFFQGVSSSHQVAKVLELKLRHQSFQWYSGLISFRMDWLDLLIVQGTLNSLIQQHSSKASILQCSVFFIVQFSHPYMIIAKTVALTRQTFVGKAMSLLFNMLSRLVIVFLPRHKHLLI